MKTLALLAALLAATPALAAEPKSVRACLKATQLERGKMGNVSVAASSGHRGADEFALKLVRVFQLDLDKGETVPRQEGYVVVDVYEDGSFGMSLFKYKGRLLRGCDDPRPLDNDFGAKDPGELGLGGVAIGQTEQAVREELGEPLTFGLAGDAWELAYEGLKIQVGYADEAAKAAGTRSVFEIVGTGAKACTPRGLCPGDDVATAQSAYALKAVERESGPTLEYTPPGDTCWLQAKPVDGKVESLRIACQP